MFVLISPLGSEPERAFFISCSKIFSLPFRQTNDMPFLHGVLF